jgi:hypothetical protein
MSERTGSGEGAWTIVWSVGPDREGQMLAADSKGGGPETEEIEGWED